MMGQTTLLEKSAKCTAAIATAFTIAKFGSDDDTLSVATAATESLVGIFQHITANAGDEVRVALAGISRVVLGGSVTRGDNLTTDGNAKAVSIGAVAGTNYNSIGRALASGSSGDIIPVMLNFSRPQG